MSTSAISLIIFLAKYSTILSSLISKIIIVLAAFIKDKNLVLRILSLFLNNYVITDSIISI